MNTDGIEKELARLAMQSPEIRQRQIEDLEMAVRDTMTRPSPNEARSIFAGNRHERRKAAKLARQKR